MKPSNLWVDWPFISFNYVLKKTCFLSLVRSIDRRFCGCQLAKVKSPNKSIFTRRPHISVEISTRSDQKFTHLLLGNFSAWSVEFLLVFGIKKVMRNCYNIVHQEQKSPQTDKEHNLIGPDVVRNWGSQKWRLIGAKIDSNRIIYKS